MRQLNLFPLNTRLFHGGALQKGQRKTLRPLNPKNPLHLVLRTQQNSLFRKRKLVRQLIEIYSLRFGVKVYHQSVQCNHVHLAIKIQDRISYQKFIRTLTGQMARRLKTRFQNRPFTRIIHWGRDFKNLLGYIEKNEREVFGVEPYEPRKNHYKKYLETG